jgi:hypothetical protein
VNATEAWEQAQRKERSRRFAYADPPYLGQCGKHYGHRHDPPWGCWDELATHQQMVDHLVAGFPDGWALSLSMPSLRHIWPMTPPGTRAGAWVKTLCVYKKGVRPAYAWEPVLYCGGRNTSPPVPEKGGEMITPKDWVMAPVTFRKGLVGAKPARVCRAVLDWLGYQDGDELVDLFPGTSSMGREKAQGVLA